MRCARDEDPSPWGGEKLGNEPKEKDKVDTGMSQGQAEAQGASRLSSQVLGRVTAPGYSRIHKNICVFE